jgi:putative aldouronate transport system permease protein
MFYFVTRWNEFFYSSIFLSSTKNTVLQVLLRKFVVENEQESLLGLENISANNMIAQLDLEAMKATTIWIALIPILIIYPIVLKYHTNGVMSGSIKE